MTPREKEYKLLQESTMLRMAYWEQDNFEKAVEMQKRQTEVYKKWKFFKNLREEMEKLNGKYYKEKSSSKSRNKKWK